MLGSVAALTDSLVNGCLTHHAVNGRTGQLMIWCPHQRKNEQVCSGPIH